MSPDEAKLYAVICYAGSDAGHAVRKEFLAEVARLRRIEAAAQDALTIALNDAGPEAFATMAALREACRDTANHTKKEGSNAE